MKACEERLHAIETRLAALERRRDSIERAERELLKAARQWARLEKLGHMLDEDGYIVRLCERDRAERAELMAATMRRCAHVLLDVDAIPEKP